jgi:putative redox protein
MLSYFFSWTPVVIVLGTLVLLTNAYLVLIALMLVALAALVALTWAAVAFPYMLGRAISLRRQGRSVARARTAALSPAEPQGMARGLQAPEARKGLEGSANHVPPPTSNTLSVVPTRRGDGFRASIRGHLLELAEPTGHGLAPTPDDLLIASIASDLAWCARRFVREHGLPDHVNVSAAWRTLENPPRLADVSVTVAVPEAAAAMSDALMTALDERVAARSLDDPRASTVSLHRESPVVVAAETQGKAED